MFKILIILTRFNTDPYIYDKNSTNKNYNYLMPIGLAYISSVLKQNNYDVDILNLNHTEGLIETIIGKHGKHLASGEKYDIVFIGGVSIYYPNIKDCIHYIRNHSPSTKIVVGGGLISSQPEIMFNLLKPDYIVVGEGEFTALELVQHLTGKNNQKIEDIKGLGYNNNGVLHLNQHRAPITDLDALPYPDFDGFGYSEFLEHQLPNYIAYDIVDNPRSYPILASRSCIFNCTFCYHTIGNKYRQRSIDNIMDEIKYAVEKYNVNIFFFYDELFAYDKQRALEFCKKFKDYADTLSWELHPFLNLHVKYVDEEIIDAMKSIKCSSIGLGLESYSDTVLKSMRKNSTSEQIKNAIKLISEKGLVTQGAFIFGDANETLETAKQTLDFYEQYQYDIGGGVRLGFIIPFQGSPLYKYCVETGIIPDEIKFIENREKYGYNFYEPMNLTKLSESDFRKLKNMVYTSMYTTGYYSIPKLCQTVNGIDEVHIDCPYCHKTSILKYKTYPQLLELHSVACRHCNRRFNMVTKHYPYIRILIKTFGANLLEPVRKFGWITHIPRRIIAKLINVKL